VNVVREFVMWCVSRYVGQVQASDNPRAENLSLRVVLESHSTRGTGNLYAPPDNYRHIFVPGIPEYD
jgi:hypothetical protein